MDQEITFGGAFNKQQIAPQSLHLQHLNILDVQNQVHKYLTKTKIDTSTIKHRPIG